MLPKGLHYVFSELCTCVSYHTYYVYPCVYLFIAYIYTYHLYDIALSASGNIPPSGPLLCNHILQQTVDSPSTIHLQSPKCDSSSTSSRGWVASVQNPASLMIRSDQTTPFISWGLEDSLRLQEQHIFHEPSRMFLE